MTVLIWIAAIFGYIFSCVVAHKVMKDVLKNWKEEADTPAVVIWPVIVLYYVCLVYPVLSFLWIVNLIPKLLRRAVTTSREVK